MLIFFFAINAHYYSYSLRNNMHQVNWKRRPGELLKIIILLHENACPHMANLTKAALASVRWEIQNYPPYSPDLIPSDFHVFGPMKMHLGQKFQSGELERNVLNWLRSEN
jgi:hypothetical protein